MPPPSLPPCACLLSRTKSHTGVCVCAVLQGQHAPRPIVCGSKFCVWCLCCRPTRSLTLPFSPFARKSHRRCSSTQRPPRNEGLLHVSSARRPRRLRLRQRARGEHRFESPSPSPPRPACATPNPALADTQGPSRQARGGCRVGRQGKVAAGRSVWSSAKHLTRKAEEQNIPTGQLAWERRSRRGLA